MEQGLHDPSAIQRHHRQQVEQQHGLVDLHQIAGEGYGDERTGRHGLQQKRKQQMHAWAGSQDEQRAAHADIADLIDLRAQPEGVDPHPAHRAMHQHGRQTVRRFMQAHHEEDRQQHFPASAEPGEQHHRRPQQQADHPSLMSSSAISSPSLKQRISTYS